MYATSFTWSNLVLSLWCLHSESFATLGSSSSGRAVFMNCVSIKVFSSGVMLRKLLIKTVRKSTSIIETVIPAKRPLKVGESQLRIS